MRPTDIRAIAGAASVADRPASRDLAPLNLNRAMTNNAANKSSISARLRDDVDRLTFESPAFVYNPLRHAWKPHALYLDRWGDLGARVLLVGMNPGPFGMAQTGVPFGDIPSVRDWLGIEAPVDRPAHEHPKRPIEGFAFGRREGSGKRLWGWAAERFGTPERFFETFFVHNYCPLLFLHESGRNITPDKLLRDEREAILAPCDRALVSLVQSGKYTHVVGVGKYAEDRATEALDGLDVEIGRILHPSPANPRANANWAGEAEDALRTLGIALP